VFRQKYGWFEVRARMPEASGYVAAFWLWVKQGLPENGGLGGSGMERTDPDNADEVDIFEFYSVAPHTNTHTLHYGPTPNSGAVSGHWSDSFTDQYASLALGQDFHVYAAEWTPTKVSIYMDDKLLGTSTHPPDLPMHMILGTKFNGDAGSPYDADFQIDYVRVYQLKGLPKGGDQ
jgi:beta-glucanase (GH16 family)